MSGFPDPLCWQDAAVMLSLSRALGRRLFSSAAAASESAAAASTSAVRKAQNPLEEFFEVDRSTEEDKPRPHYGTHSLPDLRRSHL